MADARRELDAIDRRQMQILGYLNGGFGEVESWKVEVRQNELRRAELQALLTAAASEPQPPALHPKMAGVFEQKDSHAGGGAGARGPGNARIVPERATRLYRPDRHSTGRRVAASGRESRGDVDSCRRGCR